MAKKLLPSQERLLKRLEYNPDTGVLLWLERPATEFIGMTYPAERHAKIWNAKHVGKPALHSPMANGYRHGMFDTVDYLQHRIIWKLVHGTEPDFIDHVNGVRSDNRLSNLRSVTVHENMRNRKISSNNTSGFPGVHFETRSQLWVVQLEIEGRARYVGRYSDKADAVAARIKASEGLGFTERHISGLPS